MKTTLPEVSFPANSPEEWRVAADALLKGAPFDKVMRTATPEGITLEPIYRREVLDGLPLAAENPGQGSYLRGTSAIGYRAKSWDIAQELPYGDAAAFNRALLSDLARGQNAVNVLLDLATMNGQDPDTATCGEVGACGLSIACLADLQRAFRHVLPQAVAFHFQSGCGGLAIEALFIAWLRRAKVDFASVRGGLHLDPVGTLAGSGRLPTAIEQIFDEMATLAAYNALHLPEFAAAGASGLPYHCAGASATQELGAVLATGAAYLRAMLERGVDIDSAARQIRFTLSIGGNFFMELAKLRAARPLWANIVRAFGGSDEAAKMRLHARTGLYNKTIHDPHVNMLRTTTEALSAVVAGVDSLCVGAFDECVRAPDEFSRRIARNTQIILQEECELTAVADPAGGSWFVEWLTDQVARKSWEEFQSIEAEGGIAAALTKGSIQARIAATRKEREKGLAQRRVSLVGTNQYPNVAEKLLSSELPDYKALQAKRARDLADHRVTADHEADVAIMQQLEALVGAHDRQVLPLLVEAVEHGATIGEITRALRGHAGEAPVVEALPNTRLAVSYEVLRAASTAYRLKNGHGPRIHLATLKALRRHKARADFIRAFFETGGFEVHTADGADDAAAAASAALASGAGVVVICGHDEDYPVLVPDVIRAIKASGKEISVLLAGHPGEHEAAFREAGLDDFVFVKSNNLETNRKYLSLLGAL
jgi:methylmalonyl-CoA mutase